MICLESDNESEGGNGREIWKVNDAICSDFDPGKDSDQIFTFTESTCSLSKLMLYLDLHLFSQCVS